MDKSLRYTCAFVDALIQEVGKEGLESASSLVRLKAILAVFQAMEKDGILPEILKEYLQRFKRFLC
jgi:hypothetical protein